MLCKHRSYCAIYFGTAAIAPPAVRPLQILFLLPYFFLIFFFIEDSTSESQQPKTPQKKTKKQYINLDNKSEALVGKPTYSFVTNIQPASDRNEPLNDGCNTAACKFQLQVTSFFSNLSKILIGVGVILTYL